MQKIKEMKRIEARLSACVVDDFKRICNESETSMSEVLKRLVLDYTYGDQRDDRPSPKNKITVPIVQGTNGGNSITIELQFEPAPATVIKKRPF